MGDENWQRGKMPKGAGEMRHGRAVGDCIKRDIEIEGEESRKRTKARRNWRLLIENVVREK